MLYRINRAKLLAKSAVLMVGIVSPLAAAIVIKDFSAPENDRFANDPTFVANVWRSDQ
jgi:hypothetical protein